MSVAAYPLHWPAGRTRCKWRESARFKATFTRARENLVHELERLGARNEILSSNLKLRLDGWPRSDQPAPADPGVAVYFEYKGKQHCFACDKYTHAKDNIQAIAKTIEALRGIERWGTGDMLARAFVGFEALPSSAWWHVLGFENEAQARSADVEAAARVLLASAHPDRGGSADEFDRIRRARDEARAALGRAP